MNYDHSPSITVLLPVYNAEAYIMEAVQSILAQTYRNFELLVMDDGSTDGTGAILDKLRAQDMRIRVHRKPNRGLIAVLNEGLTLSRTELIARMDADDWAYPERLATQKAYLDAHPEIAACGTGMRLYESGSLYEPRVNAPFDILCLFYCPLCHPTVMYRRSAVLAVGGYAANMYAAEDYDLWIRMCEAGYRLNNLPQPLLRYRTHPGLARPAYVQSGIASVRKIWTRQLRRLGIAAGPRQLDIHDFCVTPCLDIPWRRRKAAAWLDELCRCNERLRIFAPEAMRTECAGIYEAIPSSLSFHRNPAKFLRRLLRHACVTLLASSGTVGNYILDFLYMHLSSRTGSSTPPSA